MGYDFKNMSEEQLSDYEYHNQISMRVVEDVNLSITEVLGKKLNQITTEEWEIWNKWRKEQDMDYPQHYYKYEGIHIHDNDYLKMNHYLKEHMEYEIERMKRLNNGKRLELEIESEVK